MTILESRPFGAIPTGARYDGTALLREDRPLTGVATRPSARLAALPQTAVFSKLVRDFVRPAPVVVDESTGCANVVDRMSGLSSSVAVVIDTNGHPVGVVTEQDVTRRIAFVVDAQTPVARVMSTPVVSVAADEHLYRAIATMRRLGIRHLPVTEPATGCLTGILDIQEAMAHAADRQMAQIDLLTQEGSKDGLREVKAAQIDLAGQMLADHLPAPEILTLLTHINNDIHRRLIRAVEQEMAGDGWGDPPVAYTLILMGSGGRGENFLFPDQDNGLILDDYPDDRHGVVDAWFREFSDRLTRDLAAVGFPLCRGNCMATNPVWRKTYSQWVAQIGQWGRKRNFVALRLADLFFDFMPVYGPQEPAVHLRAVLLNHVRKNKVLLGAMWDEIKDHNVGLSVFGRFSREKQDPVHRGEFDLKNWGTLPLVETVRLLSLREGVAETSTLKRLDVLADVGVLEAEERDGLAASFTTLSHLLLRRQLDDYRIGREVSRFVPVNSMTPREKQALLAALRTVDALRKKVRGEFTGDIF